MGGLALPAHERAVQGGLLVQGFLRLSGGHLSPASEVLAGCHCCRQPRVLPRSAEGSVSLLGDLERLPVHSSSIGLYSHGTGYCCMHRKGMHLGAIGHCLGPVSVQLCKLR